MAPAVYPRNLLRLGRTKDGSIDAFLRLADGLGQTDEDGPTDEAVADVQFGHAVQPGDGGDVAVIEAMAGVELQPSGDRRLGRAAQCGHLETAGPRRVTGVGVAA